MKLPFILTSFFFIFFIRALIVLLHELGHALPAILLTRKKVTIYLGSYGNPEKNISFKIGLLEVFVNKTISWRNGLCVPSAENISINRQIIYILCGPLYSLIFSSLFFYYTIEFNLDDIYLHFSVIFLCLSIIDTWINLIPNSKPIVLFSGKKTYNDGYNIKLLLFSKKFYPKYTNAIDLYNAKEFSSAIVLFDRLLETKIEPEQIYRLNISANLQIKNYQKTKILIDEFLTKSEFNSNDYSSAGLVYSYLGFHEKGIQYYDKSLELDSNNVYSLNNKGYTLNLLEKYRDAIPFFDKAIEIESSFAYAYNNRGLSKIKTGKIDEGLQDINESIKLDANNSYNYRNLGIYHYDLGEIDKALELFLKAKALDPDTHLIEELISKSKNISKSKIIDNGKME